VSLLYEFGPFRLDPRRGLLSRGAREIHLTAKGYATLLFLVERAGSLVARDEILASLWPEGFIEPANLTQTIYVLRKSLEDSGGKLIETVTGRGYRFTQSVRCVSNPDPARLSRAARAKATVFARLPWTLAAGLLACAALALYASAPSRVDAPSVTAQAQRDYILGRHYWSQRTVPSLELGLHYFKAALRSDPQYAQAYSGVADSYSAMGYYSPYGAKQKHFLQLAREAALRAITIDPSAAEAHASLAFADNLTGPSYEPEAAKEFERSIELDASYASAREWYSWFLFGHDRQREALDQMARARDLDPLSPIINFALGNQLYLYRRYKDASAQWHQTIAIEPYSAMSYYGAGLADEQLGEHGLAVREFRRALALSPNDPDVMGALAYSCARAREVATARRLLTRIASMKPVPAYDVALVKEALGLRSQAEQWLAIAKSHHDGHLMSFSLDPRMDDLRRHASVEVNDPNRNA
jgi:DNA-binding winged helix-turn-helix (wHTH) protein/Tfp pilus assembly protein PilF